MQPYAMSSAYATMPYGNYSGHATMPYGNYSGHATPTPEVSNHSIGCFGMKPPATEHPMSSQSVYYMGGGMETSSSSYYMGGETHQDDYYNSHTDGLPSVITKVMGMLSQLFSGGLFGGLFGGQQDDAQTPINYAASTLPAYQGAAPSPYMGGLLPSISSSSLYGAPAAQSYFGSTNTSFIDQYLAGVGGQYGAGYLGDLTSQYPQLGSAPMYYPSIAPQQYVA